MKSGARRPRNLSSWESSGSRRLTFRKFLAFQKLGFSERPSADVPGKRRRPAARTPGCARPTCKRRAADIPRAPSPAHSPGTFPKRHLSALTPSFGTAGRPVQVVPACRWPSRLVDSLYVYVLSPPICESQYVVGSVKNSPCLQRGRSASSLTLMPRPGPVGTGM